MSMDQQSQNISIIVTEVGGVVVVEDDYDRVLTDLWVGVTLSLMVISCIGILCSCFLYHKFQQWKFQVLQSREQERRHTESGLDTDSLPSYTIVTGLPSYSEAMEQLRQVHILTGKVVPVEEVQQSAETTTAWSNLSVAELVQLYKPLSDKQ